MLMQGFKSISKCLFIRNGSLIKFGMFMIIFIIPKIQSNKCLVSFINEKWHNTRQEICSWFISLRPSPTGLTVASRFILQICITAKGSFKPFKYPNISSGNSYIKPMVGMWSVIPSFIADGNTTITVNDPCGIS